MFDKLITNVKLLNIYKERRAFTKMDIIVFNDKLNRFDAYDITRITNFNQCPKQLQKVLPTDDNNIDRLSFVIMQRQATLYLFLFKIPSASKIPMINNLIDEQVKRFHNTAFTPTQICGYMNKSCDYFPHKLKPQYQHKEVQELNNPHNNELTVFQMLIMQVILDCKKIPH